MRTVNKRLIAGVSVDRLHQALLNAERIIKHFDDRYETVGCTRSVRNDFLSFEVKIFVVHTVNKGRISTITRSPYDMTKGRIVYRY
jgi:hypothetical protein